MRSYANLSRAQPKPHPPPAPAGRERIFYKAQKKGRGLGPSPAAMLFRYCRCRFSAGDPLRASLPVRPRRAAYKGGYFASFVQLLFVFFYVFYKNYKIMGLPKGRTNNPNGRPFGSRNRRTVYINEWTRELRGMRPLQRRRFLFYLFTSFLRSCRDSVDLPPYITEALRLWRIELRNARYRKPYDQREAEAVGRR